MVRTIQIASALGVGALVLLTPSGGTSMTINEAFR
jgi:hypothetical protein